MNGELLQQMSMVGQEIAAQGQPLVDQYLDFVSVIAHHPEYSALAGTVLAFFDEAIGALKGESTIFNSDAPLKTKAKHFLGRTIQEGLPIYVGASLADKSIDNTSLKGYLDFGIGTLLLGVGVIPDKLIKPLVGGVLGAISFTTETLADSVKGMRGNKR